MAGEVALFRISAMEADPMGELPGFAAPDIPWPCCPTGRDWVVEEVRKMFCGILPTGF